MIDQQTIIIASERIRPYVNRTPVMTSSYINELMGCEIFFKCENFQKVGAFKSRGAVNAVFSLGQEELSRGVCTHSSGNHAQALARAAKLRGADAHIVMPNNAPQVKVDAVRGYGGNVIFCKPTLNDREATIAKVIEEFGSVEVHPYDNEAVIAGQATVGLEIFQDLNDLDYLVCPVGGGGLLSGTSLSNKYFGGKTMVIAAEPLNAADAHKSFHSKTFHPSVDPNTIADGLLTSLGKITYPLILENVHDIKTATENSIKIAMKTIWERMKILVEPSSAVPLAMMMENRVFFAGKKVAIIISGGNVELTKVSEIFKSIENE